MSLLNIQDKIYIGLYKINISQATDNNEYSILGLSKAFGSVDHKIFPEIR